MTTVILSSIKAEIFQLGKRDAREAILERRKGIRNHRDQLGDDRCFLDDYLVWKWLSDAPTEPEKFTSEDGMKECVLFYEHRRTETSDPVSADAITDPAHWDDDLETMSLSDLHNELSRLQKALRTHRDIIGRSRTVADDRALYAVLPEKIPADFRLPPKEEFLGEARAPKAGCPAFWRSHDGCKGCHNYHKWGPCR
ncbi:MAG: hypothetical protein A3D65_01550 [Candidatus Lloydbacteria bacterium RIFCSPHIGHO2_02_FULL_50_13]|uniref:Uncharacterized protein n=1 Tax=Candidatus Lloydbacteria bacterium RIFCSPHIGHO2_02_FULL_50_13 TaxID=1798661 RepID=A0A1G2D2M5_9BACT|nr:MAG: hypothetical protein A3D65_01550 [Candidatus Lloydbacteria bacterium RIFCSPHIGHO2_02_FULL_50_13]